MSGDIRGWRIALVPDALLNPAEASAPRLDVLRILDRQGYGVLQLPPAGDAVASALLLAVIADQVAEYTHHGYAVVAIGAGAEPGYGLHRRRLAALLRHRGVAALPRLVLDPAAASEQEERRLAAFLAAHDVPAEEQRLWRK